MTSSNLADPARPLVSISLTSFVDYALASDPQQRLTVVRRVKKQMQQGYSPARDSYKFPREAIQRAKGSKVDFDSLPASAKHGKHWQTIVQGFNKFIGRKTFTMRPIKRKEWLHGELVVYVNPEIALERGGVTTYYKLYFKAKPLTKRAAHTIYQMMVEMLEPSSIEAVGVLDVRRARVMAQPTPLPSDDLAALLRADAVGFVELWNNI